MIKYIMEDGNNCSNIFLVDDEYSIKILVSVVFDLAHARIILRKLNEYVAKKENANEDPFLTSGIAEIVP